ncbi:MAG TPA: ABC transporter permease [Intrasporangiaceae bacterium]|nr:ABC transporter permease [Intrasporangiaceae bacterium]
MVGYALWRFVLLRDVVAFRRMWWLFLTGFVEPVFYLFSIGIGLGALVRDVTTDSGQVVPYALFVAPAMLAASAMNGAIADTTYNFFFKLKFAKTYDTILATPARPWDIAIGEILWSLIRGGIYSAIFFLVALVMGFVRSWWAVLALPAALLIGAAFAAVGMWATTYMTSWKDFEFITLVIQPMFLFSATFFPLSVYPEGLQWLVKLMPLYHAVVIERGLLLGDVGWGLLWSVLVLVALTALGLWGASRRISRLLLT